MQNKGAIRLLAILLSLVCIYQLSFTFFAKRTEKKAVEYSNGDYKKEYYYLDSVSSQVIYNLGIKKYTYKDCKELEINLGLDLKGGMNVVLEVSVIDIIKAMSNFSTDTTFTKAIELTQKLQRNSDENTIALFGRAFTQIDPNARLAAVFNTPELKNRINFNSTNEEVLKVIDAEANSAIDNSFNVLRNRIDRFGVTQPNIQKLGTSGRILVELPGVKDQKRVRKLLQGTANLEFWETYENQEVYKFMLEANNTIKSIQEAEKVLNDTVKGVDNKEVKSDVAAVKADSADSDLALLKTIKGDTTKQDTSSLNENDFAKNYPLFALLRPNVGNNNELLNGSVVGYAHYRDTGKINFWLSLKQVRASFPRDIKFFWAIKPPKFDKSESIFELHAIKSTTRDGRAPLTGDVVASARDDISQNQAAAEVSMSMNGEGTKIWARMTKENVGRCIAIVLDGYVYSAPRVNGEITGGNSSITGDFTPEEAKDLANVLKSGKMPAPARILQEEIVGPSLGQESIDKSMMSFIIAFVLVLLYMGFYYNKAGLIANLALFTNLFFIFGVLASFGAVLTLPGLAGITLTMGIAVDNNVVIYERIREEIRHGKGVRMAISDGYKHAMSAVIDGNLTTLITAIILFIFGTGPIQGFATTLIIGIITSMFSAILISRLIFEWLLNRNNVVHFSNKFTANIMVGASYDFIGKRKIFYVFSGIIIVAGLVSVALQGFNYGVDFKGGRSYVIRYDQNVNTPELQKSLVVQFEGYNPEVKTFGSDNQVKITTNYMIEQDNATVDSIVENKIFLGSKQLLNDTVTSDQFAQNYIQTSQKVGPTISDDIKVKAFWAVLFSLIGIFLYIFIRFKDWRYGLGGIISLAHDTLIVIGAFSLLKDIMPFSMDIDSAFIAAVLTVIGFSINDTVIIYDRIREWRTLYPKRSLKELFNGGMNSTLSRTINTSLIVLFILLVIFIFGGEIIRGFIFAMLIGIAFGTYSSIFNAAPIVYDTLKKEDKDK